MKMKLMHGYHEALAIELDSSASVSLTSASVFAYCFVLALTHIQFLHLPMLDSQLILGAK